MRSNAWLRLYAGPRSVLLLGTPLRRHLSLNLQIHAIEARIGLTTRQEVVDDGQLSLLPGRIYELRLTSPQPCGRPNS